MATQATWGVKGSVSSVTGIVTDLSVSETPSLGTLQDEIGAVVGQAHYDTQTTMSATVCVSSGTNLPQAGAQITIGDETGYVRSAEKIENNQSYQKIRVTAEKFTSCDSVDKVTNTAG